MLNSSNKTPYTVEEKDVGSRWENLNLSFFICDVDFSFRRIGQKVVVVVVLCYCRLTYNMCFVFLWNVCNRVNYLIQGKTPIHHTGSSISTFPWLNLNLGLDELKVQTRELVVLVHWEFIKEFESYFTLEYKNTVCWLRCIKRFLLDERVCFLDLLEHREKETEKETSFPFHLTNE